MVESGYGEGDVEFLRYLLVRCPTYQAEFSSFGAERCHACKEHAYS